MFQGRRFYIGFCPLERSSGLVVGGNEGINDAAQLRDAAEACPAQARTHQHAKPDFHLIEPGGVGGGKVEMNLRVADNTYITNF
jgi:hypothetical protein